METERFEVITEGLLKILLFWDVARCQVAPDVSNRRGDFVFTVNSLFGLLKSLWWFKFIFDET
jgi:hypothetical protein